MAAVSCYPFKTPHFCSSLSIPKTQYSSIPSQPIHTHQLCFSLSNPGGSRLRPERRLGCAKGGPTRELERELEEEMSVIISEEDELVGVGGRWREKCEGSGGIVELMECLEREAIMGEDEGREPTDYNRRAQIFYTSSRVFQALKESNSPARPHKS